MKPIYALVDCNNFFVSCERLFRPDLEGRPVVVLSSNDGCVIARSNEAKALGIAMATPAFKSRELFQRHGVIQFSANFELYGDISERITNLLATITPRIEVYSVDESFLDLSELEIADYTAWGKLVRATVQRTIGVPVSIGITSSKTLSKLAADRAKKLPELAGVLDLIQAPVDARDHYLAQTPVRDIWGVGWKLAPKLKAEGVHSALDLARLNPRRAQQLMGIHGRHMVYELNGTACLPIMREHKPQQMIMRGRQFGEDTRELTVLESAIANLTTKAAAALRQERQLTRRAVVILSTNRHKPGYRRVATPIQLATPTADTGQLCSQLVGALQTDTIGQFAYHKADVLLYDLVPETGLQTDLFGNINLDTDTRSQTRMKAFDAINLRHGKGTVRYAAEDLSQRWQPKKKLSSPRYTSAWADLPVVRLGS